MLYGEMPPRGTKDHAWLLPTITSQVDIDDQRPIIKAHRLGYGYCTWQDKLKNASYTEIKPCKNHDLCDMQIASLNLRHCACEPCFVVTIRVRLTQSPVHALVLKQTSGGCA